VNIIHCINSPHIGGIERLVIELAIAQKAIGIEVSIMLDCFEGQYYDYFLAQDIPLLKSGIKGGYDCNLNTYRTLKLTFNRFDIVHLHSFSALRSKAAKDSNARVVQTMHGLSKGIRKENKFKYVIRESLNKYFFNKVDVFVANSRHTLNQAKAHYGLKNSTTKVVLNGIRITDADFKAKDLNDTKFIIGLVSRFTHRKRIDRLIKAFYLFLKKGGIGHCILVGDGAAYDAVKTQIKSLELESNITLVGYSNDVDQYYKQFDVLVHPSDNEGFGLIAVEAYLHGLPVLAFKDSGGLKEVVEPLEPENIVSNEMELADRLLCYAKHKTKFDENAMKRINYAKANFSIERMEREYYKIYKSLL
jgi:glycosyltransferase involved in cell wall biosynthesis